MSVINKMLLDLDARDQQREQTRDIYAALRPLTVRIPPAQPHPYRRWIALGGIVLALLVVTTWYISSRYTGEVSSTPEKHPTTFSPPVATSAPTAPTVSVTSAPENTQVINEVEPQPAAMRAAPASTAMARDDSPASLTTTEPIASSAQALSGPSDAHEEIGNETTTALAASEEPQAEHSAAHTEPHSALPSVPPTSTAPAPELDAALAPSLSTDAAPTQGPEASPADVATPLEKTARPLSVAEQAENEYRRALQLLREQRGREAARHLHQALSLQPKHVPARDTLVTWMLSQGHWERVKPILIDGISLVPEHYRYAQWLARVYVDQGQDARAIGLLEGARTLARQDAEYLGLLASIYQRNARHSDARLAFQQAAALQPQQARWWLGAAISAEALADWGAAEAAYTQVVSDARGDIRLREYAEQRLRAMDRQRR